MKATQFLSLIVFFLFGCTYSANAQRRVILPFVGNGLPSSIGDGGPATAAYTNYPIYVSVDHAGNIFITEANGHRIRKIDVSGIITTIAGTGTIGYSGDGGPATVALLNTPHAAVPDNKGNVYICDDGNQVIRKIDTAGIITTIAGNGDGSYGSPDTSGYNGDNIAATAAELNAPFQIALDTTGNLFIADTYNQRVRKVDISSGIITTIAGNGTYGYSGDGGPATGAQLSWPKGLVTDASGNVYIGEQNNNCVRNVNTFGIITTIVGIPGGGATTTGDGGPATAATLDFPTALTFDYWGNLYIVDYTNNVVRKVDMTGIITTIAGNGMSGYSGNGGLAIAASLSGPTSVATDSFGIIYIAERQNNCIRILDYAPAFIGNIEGERNIATCQDSAIAINSILAVIDSDRRQTETWSLVAAPAHGSATVAYAAISTGAILTPSGLTYTPLSGYTGADTFMVRVTDGHVSDTTAIYVSIDTCAITSSKPVSAPGDALNIYPNPSDGTFTVTLASAINENGTLIITDLPGRKIKEQAIRTNIPATIATGLPGGVYLLNALTAHGRWYKRVVIK